MIFSLRLGCLSHRDPEYIDLLIAELKRAGDCIDEIWLATSYGLPSVEDCKREAVLLGDAAEKFRTAGFIASIQVSRTVGHGDTLLTTYGSEGVSNLNADMITDIDGNKSKAQFCWNNKAFREFIRECLEAYMTFGPEIVWTDDDLRLRAIGCSKALCFCDHCISLFNERFGYDLTRDELRERFLHTDADIRRQYIDFQTETLADFGRLISEAVHKVSPKSRIALQNGGSTMLAVNAQRSVLNAMKEVTGLSPAFRAGGGFYHDHDPAQMLNKAILLNYMNSRLPAYVTMRSCEIENLPFVAYGKSPECACIEAALYIAYGCNMASVTLMRTHEPLEYHRRMFERIAQYKPYYNAVVKANTETANSGLCVYQPVRSHYVYHEVNAKEAWNDTVVWDFCKLMRCGIPFHAEPSGDVFILSPKAACYICDEDMDVLLRSPVVTDAETIERLIRCGYGDKLNVQVRMLPDNCRTRVFERPCEHPINAGLALTNWSDKRAFSISGDDIERVAEYYTFLDNEYCGCASAVITTAYGAKWFVKGMGLTNDIISHQRRDQFVHAVHYIAGRDVLTYEATENQTAVIPRINADGKTVTVTLLNVSITRSENMRIAVTSPANTERCTVLDPYSEPKSVPVIKKNGSFTVTLDVLDPWRVKTIVFGG